MTRTFRKEALLGAFLLVSGITVRAHADCFDGTTHSCTVNGQPGVSTCEGGEWSLCEGPNGVPSPPPPPLKIPSRIARTATSISLRNDNTQPGTYRLKHLVGTTWVQVVTLAPGATFVRGGLVPDTKHCYRFEVPSHTTNSSCGYTTDGTGNKAWRVQLELTTADIGDAGTGDAVSVGLNETRTNFTWLDYGRNDDFARHTTYTYDLRLDGIDYVSDINSIRLHKYETNGWCLAGFRLLVNGVPAYAQAFAAQPNGCLWLDNDDGHLPEFTVDHDTLHHSAAWLAYVQPARFSLSGTVQDLTATLVIPQAELQSRVEALFGDALHGTAAYWGGRHGTEYVEATASTQPGTVHFDLDLMASIAVLPNPELDVDFDFKFAPRCSDDHSRAEVVLTADNLVSDVQYDWWLEVLRTITMCDATDHCLTNIEHIIQDRFAKAFASIDLPVSSESLPQGYRCVSGDVAVNPNGTVRLIFQLTSTPGFTF